MLTLIGLMAIGGIVATDPASGSTAGTESRPEKRICRSMPNPNGSRISHMRVCKTAIEWEADRKAVQDAVDRYNSGDKTQTRKF